VCDFTALLFDSSLQSAQLPWGENTVDQVPPSCRKRYHFVSSHPSEAGSRSRFWLLHLLSARTKRWPNRSGRPSPYHYESPSSPPASVGCLIPTRSPITHHFPHQDACRFSCILRFLLQVPQQPLESSRIRVVIFPRTEIADVPSPADRSGPRVGGAHDCIIETNWKQNRPVLLAV
jgi:hypothetical protein